MKRSIIMLGLLALAFTSCVDHPESKRTTRQRFDEANSKRKRLLRVGNLTFVTELDTIYHPGDSTMFSVANTLMPAVIVR
jgi:hypothetical protein